MIKFLKWFLSPTKKYIVEEIDSYSKLIELEKNYNDLFHHVKHLEEESIEHSNNYKKIMSLIEAIDNRIDILRNN